MAPPRCDGRKDVGPCVAPIPVGEEPPHLTEMHPKLRIEWGAYAMLHCGTTYWNACKECHKEYYNVLRGRNRNPSMIFMHPSMTSMFGGADIHPPMTRTFGAADGGWYCLTATAAERDSVSPMMPSDHSSNDARVPAKRRRHEHREQRSGAASETPAKRRRHGDHEQRSDAASEPAEVSTQETFITDGDVMFFMTHNDWIDDAYDIFVKMCREMCQEGDAIPNLWEYTRGVMNMA